MADRVRKQRNFKLLSMVGFGSTLLCTWEVMLS